MVDGAELNNDYITQDVDAIGRWISKAGSRIGAGCRCESARREGVLGERCRKLR